MTITKRSTKGSELTWDELDGNFEHLDSHKVEKTVLAGGNRVLVQVAPDGEPAALVIPEGYVIGRLTGGELAAIPMGSIEVDGVTESELDAAIGAEETARINGDASTLASAQTYADGLLVGLWNDRGNHDASGGSYPSTGGSGSGGAIKKGDIWTISVAGTLPTGQVVNVGDSIRAKTNTPGNTQANWAIIESNIGYTPENAANKNASGGYAGLSGFVLQLKNALGTVTSLLTNAATAIRTYTLPDKDLHIIGTEDIINDLSTGGIDKALSAEQGKTLNTGKANLQSPVFLNAAETLQTLTDGATINWNCNLGGNAVVTLGGNRTIANPTNTVNGAVYVLELIQDGTGSRTITWGANFIWSGATAPTLTTTANKRDFITFVCRNGKLYGVDVKNFA